MLRYVESNPLRAGLAKRAEQWPWSSLSGREQAQDMLGAWPVDRPRGWTELVNEIRGTQVEAVRESVIRGRPFGGEAWQRRVAGNLGLENTFRARGRPKKKRRAEVQPHS